MISIKRRTGYLGSVLAAIAFTGIAAIPAAASPVTAIDAGPAMPDLVGKPLDVAYQAFDYRTRITAEDLSGAGRHVVWPANWKVCTQDPAPGVVLVDNARVTLGAVKKDETCPKNG
ncbi:hypothetical protein [Amycolatopsis pittospori]|uniref:hypothetical protein n=1 Tax=Amycolatopsis pittospori TaxID=2749434 RepID=UPI0015EFFE4C|nr:hypothetical protein [Amycolatopsis pittospori]